MRNQISLINILTTTPFLHVRERHFEIALRNPEKGHFQNKQKRKKSKLKLLKF